MAKVEEMFQGNATAEPFEDNVAILSQSSYLQFYLAYNIVFIVFGLCSNFLILCAIKQNTKLHNFGSVFICSLALSDLSVLFMADVFTVVGILTQGNVLIDNPSLCIWSSYFCLSFCFCSFWSIAGASFHTYLHVSCHFFYLKHVNGTKIAFAVVCIWIWCVLLLLPSVFGWGNHIYDSDLMYCVFEYTFYAPYTVFLVVFGTILPLAVTTGSYIAIAYAMRKSRNKLRRQFNEMSPGIVAKFPQFCSPAFNPVEKRLMRSLIFIAIYLVLTWVFLMVIWVIGDRNTWKITVPAMLLAHSHCGINAVLYIVSNKHVRIGVQNIFKRSITNGSPVTNRDKIGV